jgi:L-methionine (R)-S-oxide reductase
MCQPERKRDAPESKDGVDAVERAGAIEGDAVPVSYDLLEQQARALLAGETSVVANAANFAAFVYHELPDVNWCGFYFVEDLGDLVLGPFGGKPACTRLPRGRGVCGAAVTRKQTVVVDDVGTFAGHIVCDSASRSEIVVPLWSGNDVVGVFDVDSPRVARFTESDRVGIEGLTRAFARSIGYSAGGGFPGGGGSPGGEAEPGGTPPGGPPGMPG